MTLVSKIPALLSTAMVAKITGWSVPHVTSLVRKGDLKASRIGRTLCITGPDLLAFIEARPARNSKGQPLKADGTKRTVRGGRRFEPASASSAKLDKARDLIAATGVESLTAFMQVGYSDNGERFESESSSGDDS
jgi:excisionase family DNA binding protein